MMALIGLTLAATAAFGPMRPGAEPSQTGEVVTVALASSPGSADFRISLRGDAQLQAFQLDQPNRLVLDLNGAKLASRTALYDGVNRGGVTNIRASQFKPGVVRIVLDLDSPKKYSVARTDGTITVSIETDRVFAAWTPTGDTGDTRTLVRAATVRPSNDDDDAPLTTRTTTMAAQARVQTVADVEPEADPAQAELRRVIGVAPSATAAEPRITVTFDKTPIADVVASFASFSGRSIILGKGIAGDVSAEIKNQPWPQALQALLSSQGLTAAELPGGIIRVDAPAVLASLDSTEPLETTIKRINYANAGSLARTVESIVTPKRGRVIADTASNALIITDTKSKLASVVEFVNGLDVRTPQLSLQAKIIFVDRTDIEQLGVKYDLGGSNTYFNSLVNRGIAGNVNQADASPYRVGLGGSQVAAIGNGNSSISSSALSLIFTTAIGGFSLSSFLEGLSQQQLSDVQAEPIISTLDNQKADILVGQEVPLRVIDASSIGTTTVRATVQFREVGIRLTVTPHVTNNRQILMNLYTERSAIRTLAAADLGFTIDKQKTTNQLLVSDGETAVIGGLTVTTVTKNRSGIPILSNLPLIGGLFGYSTSQEQRQDLIVLITPRIIDEGGTN
jgi:type IV pilus assembly protein PilQ